MQIAPKSERKNIKKIVLDPALEKKEIVCILHTFFFWKEKYKIQVSNNKDGEGETG